MIYLNQYNCYYFKTDTQRVSWCIVISKPKFSYFKKICCF